MRRTCTAARRTQVHARELLGTIQMSRADYCAAREMLQTSLHERPDDRGALQLLSTISLLEGDAAKGLEYAQKVAALEPESAEVQDALLMAKLIANQDFDFAPEVAADSSDAYTRALLVALNDFRKGRLMGALEQARALHTQHPDRIDPLNLIAACLLATGQWDAARTELNKTLALEPNEVSAARNLALLEIRSKNMPRAKVLLEQLLATHPGDEAAALCWLTCSQAAEMPTLRLPRSRPRPQATPLQPASSSAWPQHSCVKATSHACWS